VPAAHPTRHLFSNILLPLLLDNRHSIRLKHRHSLALPLGLAWLAHRSRAIAIPVVIISVSIPAIVARSVAPVSVVARWAIVAVITHVATAVSAVVAGSARRVVFIVGIIGVVLAPAVAVAAGVIAAGLVTATGASRWWRVGA
jgi:hypothetical protein